MLQRQDLFRDGAEDRRRFWLKALTRKRARPSISKEKPTLQELFVDLCAGIAHDVVDHGMDGLRSSASTLIRITFAPDHHRRKAADRCRSDALVSR